MVTVDQAPRLDEDALPRPLRVNGLLGAPLVRGRRAARGGDGDGGEDADHAEDEELMSVYTTRRDAVVRADEGRLPPRRADRTGTRSTADREAR